MAIRNVKVAAVAETVATEIAQAMEDNPGAWHKPWSGFGEQIPHNPVSGAVYTGINHLWLGIVQTAQGYKTGRWATYKQWQKAGAQVSRGSRGTTIIRVQTYVRHDEGCDRSHQGPTDDCYRGSSLRAHNVFHESQVEGSENVPTHPDIVWNTDVGESADEVENVFRGIGADWMLWHQDGCYYSETQDRIVTPVPEQFETLGWFAHAVAHEHIHWSGHSSRLDRLPGRGEYVWGDSTYASEEFVAELGAIMFTRLAGLPNGSIRNNAAYLKGWAKQLRSDQGGQMILTASAQAQKAARFLMDRAAEG